MDPVGIVVLESSITSEGRKEKDKILASTHEPLSSSVLYLLNPADRQELSMLRQIGALRSFWHMPTRNQLGGNSRSYLKVRQTPVAWGTVTVYLPS